MWWLWWSWRLKWKYIHSSDSQLSVLICLIFVANIPNSQFFRHSFDFRIHWIRCKMSDSHCLYEWIKELSKNSKETQNCHQAFLSFSILAQSVGIWAKFQMSFWCSSINLNEIPFSIIFCNVKHKVLFSDWLDKNWIPFFSWCRQNKWKAVKTYRSKKKLCWRCKW